MKLFEVATGFIAAVLIALGAYQYVNNNTVEKEPVVKKGNTETLAPVTFYHTGSGQYEKTPASGTDCQPVQDFPCTITYDNEEDVEGINQFEYDDRPLEDRTESTDGVWM